MTGPILTPRTARKELTYEEYLKTPEIRQRYEIIEGKMIMSPAATTDHQWILSTLFLLLTDFAKSRRLGAVLPAPLDIIIRKTPKLQTRQPDIIFLSTARTGIRSRKDVQQMPQLEIAPDLAVEILSPDEVRKRLTGKLADYATIEVPEVWVVSPKEETVEVLQLKQGDYVRASHYRQGESVRSTVLPELSLSVEAIFE